jgi:hypothetical protein
MDQHSFQFRLGFAWIGLALALGLHVVDEATTGFLAVYNTTVIEARSRWSWFPMPTFAFNDWLFGLTAFVILLLTLSPLAFRNARGIRPVAYFLSAVMLLNAVGHTLATIAGRTFASIRFQRPAPGFYSSPVLVVASVYLLVQLRRTRDARRGIAAVGSS